MANKELTAFRVAPELMAAMRSMKDREGIPISQQLDFAVRAWLRKKGVALKAPRGRRPAPSTATRSERS